MSIEPALLKPPDAAKFLGIGIRKLWELKSCGKIPYVSIGRCVLYSVESLRQWITENEIKR